MRNCTDFDRRAIAACRAGASRCRTGGDRCCSWRRDRQQQFGRCCGQRRSAQKYPASMAAGSCGGRDGEEAESKTQASAEGRITSGRVISAVERFQSLPACRHCTRCLEAGILFYFEKFKSSNLDFYALRHCSAASLQRHIRGPVYFGLVPGAHAAVCTSKARRHYWQCARGCTLIGVAHLFQYCRRAVR